MQATKKLLVKYTGSTSPTALSTTWQPVLKKASEGIGQKYPKVTEAKIQGNQPHKSSKDPSDTKDVITVSYSTARGTRITSVHLHEDGTYTEFPSRNAYRGK